MTAAEAFVELLDKRRFDFFTGVPCSYLGGPLSILTAQDRYLPAVNEGAALALAAGAAAGGARSAVFAQNSGFGNLINPLTSLLLPYRIPVLIVMSLRGWPDPDGDEPQHRVMGAATHAILDTLGVAHRTLTDAHSDVDAALADLDDVLADGLPAALLVAKRSLDGAPRRLSGTGPRPPGGPPARADVLRTIAAALPDALLVATTGYTSRELHAYADAPRCFYMQGSMGHAGAFAFGTARTAGPERTVVVLDGDGAALMHLGTLATIGAHAPENLLHVVLDNGRYESTGGQPTLTRASFADTARALGYRRAWACSSTAQVTDALRVAQAEPGPALLSVRIESAADSAPPRATSAISAPDIYRRFAAAARQAGS